MSTFVDELALSIEDAETLADVPLDAPETPSNNGGVEWGSLRLPLSISDNSSKAADGSSASGTRSSSGSPALFAEAPRESCRLGGSSFGAWICRDRTPARAIGGSGVFGKTLGGRGVLAVVDLAGVLSFAMPFAPLFGGGTTEREIGLLEGATERETAAGGRAELGAEPLACATAELDEPDLDFEVSGSTDLGCSRTSRALADSVSGSFAGDKDVLWGA
ncbi:MAG TPA: hypothetical protein VKP30_11460 [Polyangiaceae bacterium]|nr:hypothetical protein [Polyangiaceae bacterium]